MINSTSKILDAFESLKLSLFISSDGEQYQVIVGTGVGFGSFQWWTTKMGKNRYQTLKAALKEVQQMVKEMKEEGHIELFHRMWAEDYPSSKGLVGGLKIGKLGTNT